MARKQKTQANKKQLSEKTTDSSRIGNDQLPRRPLGAAIKIGEVLYNTYAGKSASPEDIASALDVSVTNNEFKYLLWSAIGFGVVHRDEAGMIALSETGRKIVAPTYEGEDQEAKKKAVLTPAIPSRFLTDYDGHPLPDDRHFPNVLANNFKIPRDRIEEAKAIIIDSASYAQLLQPSDSSGVTLVRLSNTGRQSPPLTRNVQDDNDPASNLSEDQLKAMDWQKTCFFISPIGAEASEPRRHADMMLKHLVEPVADEMGLYVVRADKIERSGLITQQVLNHIVHSRLCIVDLSFGNPNVFYELGVRHSCKRPSIQFVKKGDPIPFDVSQGRTIIIDTSDVYTIMDRFSSARKELREYVRRVLDSDEKELVDDNPVAVYLPRLRISIPAATEID